MLTAINKWEGQQYARFLEKLRAIPEGEGNLLDHSMVLWCSELGNPNAHSCEDMPAVVGGRGAGALSPGQRVQVTPATPWANLLLTLIRRGGAGAGIPSFGNSTGEIETL